jgi:hypothetical protein
MRVGVVDSSVRSGGGPVGTGAGLGAVKAIPHLAHFSQLFRLLP